MNNLARLLRNCAGIEKARRERRSFSVSGVYRLVVRSFVRSFCKQAGLFSRRNLLSDPRGSSKLLIPRCFSFLAGFRPSSKAAMPLALGNRQLACFAPHLRPQCLLDASVGDPIVPRRLHLPAERATQFLRRSASVAGSGAEFSERLVGTERKKKGRNIAGVDQDELVDPALLSDPDSFFYEFKGVQIHHKVCCPEQDRTDQSLNSEAHSGSADGILTKDDLPMILFHGFGASSFSWNRVLKPLANLIGSSVLAFDRPAFGLTSRPRYDLSSARKPNSTAPLNPYSIAFSVLATLSFIERFGSQKAVLVGHSAGCFVAVDAYFEYPERIAALILVAPAIFAPIFPHNAKKDGKIDGGSAEDDLRNPFTMIWNLLCRLVGFIVQNAMKIFKGMKDVLRSLNRIILTAVLRSTLCRIIVRMIIDKYGVAAIRASWCDPSKITDVTINGYTKPLRMKDWDASLLEYTLAMLTNSGAEAKPASSTKLARISCPVLIITGDVDRVIPRWNAERLASAIPGSTFHVIKDCGHFPHEEKADEFLEVVKRFLQNALGKGREVTFASSS